MSTCNIYKRVDIETDAVLDAIERRFSFVVDKIVRLRGFCDLTYHVVEGGKNRREYIFKVFANPFSTNATQVEAEISLMLYLHGNGLPVPQLIPAKNPKHNFYSIVDFSMGNPTYTRLQSRLPGKMIHDVEWSCDLWKKVGIMAGNVDKVLESYKNNFYLENREPEFIVNYNKKRKLRECLPMIKNEIAAPLAESALKLFEDKVSPNTNKFPQRKRFHLSLLMSCDVYCSIEQIHGDLDSANIVVDEKNVEKDGLPAIGLIDFGDSRVSCRIYEVATAIASILAYDNKGEKFALAFLAGYQSIINLDELEIKLLRV